jgi:hypothetical protein
MFYDDHSPPHFHVDYGEYMALVGIWPIQVLRGSLPRRAQGLVFEWAAIHQAELTDNWQRARAGEALAEIAPLD